MSWDPGVVEAAWSSMSTDLTAAQGDFMLYNTTNTLALGIYIFILFILSILYSLFSLFSPDNCVMAKRKTTAGGYDDSSDGLDPNLDTSPKQLDPKRSKSTPYAPPRVTMRPVATSFQLPGSTRGFRHVSTPALGRPTPPPPSSGRATPAPPSTGYQTPDAQTERNTPETQIGTLGVWFRCIEI